MARTLARWPNVQRDASDRVVAFGGLSLLATKHRFEVASRQLYTWCAWDTLFLPALLAQDAHVESNSPITGADVRLTVGPDGVRSSLPSHLLVSFPPLAQTTTPAIVESFCCHVHFLAGRDAAARWLTDNHDGQALGLDGAFEVGWLATSALREGGR